MQKLRPSAARARTAPSSLADIPSAVRHRFGRALALVLLAIGGAGGPAQAQTCDAVPAQAQMVQANFQRVAKEGDLASTIDYAERAQRGLEQLANQARRCACEDAQLGYENAAKEMRLARLADSRKAVREIADRAAPLLEAALAAQRKCAGF